ncbi:MAG: glycosyltransferase [Actinomycetota bacterium]|nr:glycosyltransferase [Actinomycetota bacterium]
MSAPAEKARFSIVCVSPQAWGTDLPTNRQQIMRRAARRGHEVLFVESGSFLWRDASRILRHPSRELHSRLAGELVEGGIRVRSALNVVPWGKKYELASRFNFGVTAGMLRRAVKRLPPPTVLWIYDPCAVSLIGKLGETFAVYDCVDDYAEQYAPDPRRMALVAAADKEVGRRSEIVFATTEPLAERHRQANSKTYLVSNAADYPHFAPAANRSLAAPEVRELLRPVIGFAGNLTAGKVDFTMLRAVAAERPRWTLLLIGPARPGAEDEVNRLAELPNVRWLGWKAYQELPRYVAAFDVGLCPYIASAYMRNVFPLKVYEYLAAGKPVVASGTPSLSGMEPDVVVVDGADALVRAVETALDRSTAADVERRMTLAARNTWEGRTERLLTLVADELEGRAPA